jgi:hypothetical protein
VGNEGHGYAGERGRGGDELEDICYPGSVCYNLLGVDIKTCGMEAREVGFAHCTPSIITSIACV